MWFVLAGTMRTSLPGGGRRWRLAKVFIYYILVKLPTLMLLPQKLNAHSQCSNATVWRSYRTS